MKRISTLQLVMAAGLAGLSSAASAQSYSDEPIIIEKPAAAYRDRPSYGPPVYGYTSSQAITIEKPAAAYRDPARVYGYTQYYQYPTTVPASPRTGREIAGGCGEFRYWNGEACADARDKPGNP